MKDYLLLIDYSLRRLFSMLFRMVIVIYGIIIVLNFKNEFPLYFYIIGAIVYYSSLFLIYVKSHRSSIIRLLVDYLFIAFIVYGKDLDNFFIFSYTVLPLLNLPNRSGIGKNLSIFLCIPISIVMFILIGKWLVILPYLIILGINEFERLRINIRNINQQQFRKIDNFYIESYYPQKLYKIYEHIIEDIEKTLLRKFFVIDHIICFKLNNGKLKLFNSSKLIMNYYLENQEDILYGLDQNLIKRNKKIIIDGKSNKKNLVFVITGNKQKFLFIIITKYYLNIPLVTNALIESIFVPSFKYLVKLFEFESELRLKNKEILGTIKKKYEFVLKSTNAMHFVKNKLSPAKTLTELADTFFNKSRQDDVTLKKLIRTSIKKSINNFKRIEDHTKHILEKSKNPFIVNNIEQHKLGRLVYLLRIVYNDHITNGNIYFEGDISQVLDIKLEYDDTIMEIVFIDILENTFKYYNEESNIKIVLKESLLQLIFENNINTKIVNVEELKKIIEDYNTSKKWEINEQKQHGLTLIKSYLNQMDIENKIYLENDNFRFHLEFKVF